MRESTVWDETARGLGGEARRKGSGELGLLSGSRGSAQFRLGRREATGHNGGGPTCYPVGEAGESIETVGVRIVFDKLNPTPCVSVRASTSIRGGGTSGGKAHTARVPPASALVLRVLRRLPLPRPLKGNRLGAVGAIIANESDVGILVEVRIGVKFSGDQGLDLFGRGGIDVGERIDAGIERLWVGVYRCVGGLVGLSLADDEGELEVYFVVVCEL